VKDRLNHDLESQYPKLNAAGYNVTSKRTKFIIVLLGLLNVTKNAGGSR